MSGEGLTSVGVSPMGKRRPALSLRALIDVVVDAAFVDFLMDLEFVSWAGDLGLRVCHFVGDWVRGIY